MDFIRQILKTKLILNPKIDIDHELELAHTYYTFIHNTHILFK